MNFGKIQLLNGDNLGKSKQKQNGAKIKIKKTRSFYIIASEASKKEKFLVFCLLIVANFGKSQLLNRARFD